MVAHININMQYKLIDFNSSLTELHTVMNLKRVNSKINHLLNDISKVRFFRIFKGKPEMAIIHVAYIESPCPFWDAQMS